MLVVRFIFVTPREVLIKIYSTSLHYITIMCKHYSHAKFGDISLLRFFTVKNECNVVNNCNEI